ncbi:hypothetical protein QLG07_18905 [Erwinia sp. V90_4]|uniref:hypothetical protein n=1 Tax=Erwinia sp. V90_4 TaxID=3044239 RepID=UPI00249DCE2E|nr:hypothetical protein [Erwinia sp. V90_4]MDI3441539.1 hypothetical protein [Erwinia sp. V90_4]
MLFITSLVLSFILAASLSRFQRNSRVYLTVVSFSYIYSLFFMCVVFLLLKFNGENGFVFPDESFYVNDNASKLPFSVYVREVGELFGLDFIRVINIFVFTTAFAALTSEIMLEIESKKGRLLVMTFALMGIVVGGYWSYFILKEAFSIAALSFLLVASLRKSPIYFLSSLLFLGFARPELFILYIGVLFGFYLKKKNKRLFYFVVLIFLLSFIYYLNSPYAHTLKLFTLSKRFGELNVSYDAETLIVSDYNLIPFILSGAFHQALITNIVSTFYPFLDMNPLVIFQRTFNILAMILFLKSIRGHLLRDRAFTFLFVILIGLLTTHSVYRYINTLLIPFSIYFIYLNDQKIRKVGNGKDFNNNTSL